MLVTVHRRRKSIIIDVKKTGFFSRGFGLMFHTSDTQTLLFDFFKPSRVAITSWFVFFPFLAVWLDEHNRVIETRIVKPFILSFKPIHPAKTLIEIPINRKNRKLIRFFVGK
jgi:uncharacterized membrane protein (UPF0127 family)